MSGNEEDELPAPGFAFEQHSLKFSSVEKDVEIELKCLDRLSLFDAVGLLEGNDCTGLRVWPGACGLCKYIARHPKIVLTKKVLELGAGAGLVGLLAGKLNAREVNITDSSEDSLELLQKNVEENFSGDKRTLISVGKLDWNTNVCKEKYEVILASDVIYFRESVEPLFRTVREHLSLSSERSEFLLCFSTKGKELNGYVLEVATTLGFSFEIIEEITTDPSAEEELLAYRFYL